MSTMPVSIALKNSNNFPFSSSMIFGKTGFNKLLSSYKSVGTIKVSIIAEYTVLKTSVFNINLLKKESAKVS